MLKMYLRQPGFMYSACGLFTKIKERTQEFKGTADSRYNCQSKLDKACFQYDMAYGDFKDLPRKTASDKVLCNEAFKSAENPKYNGFQLEIASLFYKLFEK